MRVPCQYMHCYTWSSISFLMPSRFSLNSSITASRSSIAYTNNKTSSMEINTPHQNGGRFPHLELLCFFLLVFSNQLLILSNTSCNLTNPIACIHRLAQNEILQKLSNHADAYICLHPVDSGLTRSCRALLLMCQLVMKPCDNATKLHPLVEDTLVAL